MANQRFTQIPEAASADMSDIVCAVKGYVSPSNIGVSYQETLQQIYDLFQSNVILSNAGNPNGQVAGKTYQLCWDTTNNLMYVCTQTGSALTAVWTVTTADYPSSPVFTQVSFSPTTNGILGVTDASAAASGYVGEYVNTAVSSSSPIPVTSSADFDITTLNLTAGGWMVWGGGFTVPQPTTITNTFEVWINTVSMTPPNLDVGGYSLVQVPAVAGANVGTPTGQTILNLSAPTTIYLSGTADFSVDNLGVSGFISALRYR